MSTILHTTFSNNFFSIKIVVFWFEFHWNLFAKAQLLRRTNDGIFYWRMYTSLSLDMLTQNKVLNELPISTMHVVIKHLRTCLSMVVPIPINTPLEVHSTSPTSQNIIETQGGYFCPPKKGPHSVWCLAVVKGSRHHLGGSKTTARGDRPPSGHYAARLCR